MEKILHEVLADDESLLCRRDELIAALEPKVPGNKSRDFASIKKALSLNVGEKFFVGKTDKDATKTEVAKILKDGGLQEARINFVIETFTKALDWDKPPAPEPEKKSDDADKAESPNVNEIFKQAKATQSVKEPEPAKPAPPKQSPPKPSPEKSTYQPPSQPPPQRQTQQPPQPTQSTATQSTNNKNLLIGLACVAMMILFFMAGKNSNQSTPAPPPSSTTTEVQQNQPSSPPAEDTAYLNARTDLSLNGMDLDIPVSEAEKILGKPNSIKKMDNHDRYIYSDKFYISVANGKVIAFVTEDPKFKTLRGIHVGSTYGEVVDKYGTNSKDTQAEGLTLREYPFNSIDGNYSLLRFAINKSGLVEYISIRTVEVPSLGIHWIKDANSVYLWNPEPQEGESITWSGGFVQDGAHKFADGNGVVTWYDKNGTAVQIDEGPFKHGQRNGRFVHKFLRSGNTVYTTWDNGKEVANSNSGVDANVEQAATAFIRYHKLITSGDYSAAFNLFTDERKANMNYNVQAFAKGYSNTITSEITDLNLVSSSGNSVVMDYVLDARDRASGGRTLYQQFRGQVEMVKIGGEWKIASTQSKRIREVMER